MKVVLKTIYYRAMLFHENVTNPENKIELSRVWPLPLQTYPVRGFTKSWLGMICNGYQSIFNENRLINEKIILCENKWFRIQTFLFWYYNTEN